MGLTADSGSQQIRACCVDCSHSRHRTSREATHSQQLQSPFLLLLPLRPRAPLAGLASSDPWRSSDSSPVSSDGAQQSLQSTTLGIESLLTFCCSPPATVRCAAYATQSSSPSMASCDVDGGACALPAKGARKSAPPSGKVTYDMILDADVQTVNTAADSGNPLPEGQMQKLRDFIPETGAVLFLVRRPG